LREIDAQKIMAKVKELMIQPNMDLPDDVLNELEKSREIEECPIGIKVFNDLTENAQIACKGKFPLCQDT